MIRTLILILIICGNIDESVFAQSQTPSNRIRFLTHVFIPNIHPTLPKYFFKTESGKYVIEAPNIILPGTDIGDLSGTCFLTDNRTFSSDPMASSRVTLDITLEFEGNNMSIVKDANNSRVRIGETVNVNCKSGEALNKPKTANSNCVSISPINLKDYIYSFDVKISCGNPFYIIMGTGIAPRTDADIKFSYHWPSRKFKINVETNNFPSFEMYAIRDNTNTISLIKLDPEKESTALSLIDLWLPINKRTVESKFTVKR